MSSFEVRHNDDGTLDEIVARGADVHLEQMSGTHWFLEVASGSKRMAIWLTASRKIGAFTEDRSDPLGPETKKPATE